MNRLNTDKVVLTASVGLILDPGWRAPWRTGGRGLSPEAEHHVHGWLNGAYDGCTVDEILQALEPEIEADHAQNKTASLAWHRAIQALLLAHEEALHIENNAKWTDARTVEEWSNEPDGRITFKTVRPDKKGKIQVVTYARIEEPEDDIPIVLEAA